MAAVDSCRLETGVQGGAAHRIVDDVETGAARMLGHVVIHRAAAVIDETGAQRLDDSAAGGAARGIHRGAKGDGELHGHVAHAARAAMHEYAVARLHTGAVDQPFPGRDEDEGQGGRLAQAQSWRCTGASRAASKTPYSANEPWMPAMPPAMPYTVAPM